MEKHAMSIKNAPISLPYKEKGVTCRFSHGYGDEPHCIPIIGGIATDAFIYQRGIAGFYAGIIVAILVDVVVLLSLPLRFAG